MAVPPAALIMSAVSSMVSGRPYDERLPRTLRPVQYTVAPASPRARAMPRPAPRVAPATTATCPARRLFFFAIVNEGGIVARTTREPFSPWVQVRLKPDATYEHR